MAGIELETVRAANSPWELAKHSLLLFAAIISGSVLLGLVVAGCSNANVQLINDTGTHLRISHCVDDALDVDVGQTFEAYGATENNQLFCLITRSEFSDNEHCVAIPHADALSGAFPLSQAIRMRGACP